MQSLCTLRNHCRQWPRNTRYQAGAAPYLDRTSTGWIAPACLAHSFDHLVGAAEQRQRDGEAERVSSLEINEQLDFRALLHRQVSRLLALEDAARVDASKTKVVRNIPAVAHQAAGRGKLPVLID